MAGLNLKNLTKNQSAELFPFICAQADGEHYRRSDGWLKVKDRDPHHRRNNFSSMPARVSALRKNMSSGRPFRYVKYLFDAAPLQVLHSGMTRFVALENDKSQF
jgi:hypothetical protein